MMSAAIPLIVEQHAEEAAFLWLLRSHAIKAPHYDLKDLAKIDNRVEAHLDGLRSAGDDGWKLSEQALKIGEAGEVFTAAILALESKDPRKLAQVIGLAEASPEAYKGLISALGWIEPAKLSGTVQRLLNSNSSFERLIGLSACAVHRVNPGNILDELLRAPDTSVQLRARALRTAGELKRRDLIHQTCDHLRAEDAAVRYWAAWAAVLMGNRSEALEALKTFVAIPSTKTPNPLPTLLRALPLDQAQALLKGLAQYPERIRDLISGAGIVGDPLYIPWLIQQMQVPALARLAGEAFSLISGIDLAYDDLEGERPQDFESGPTEDPADHNVELDSDEDLPWPDPAKIQVWWAANQQQFQIGTRYLLGTPLNETQCRHVLRTGFQRQRVAAALELALLKHDEILFEVRGPGWRQQRLLLQS